MAGREGFKHSIRREGGRRPQAAGRSCCDIYFLLLLLLLLLLSSSILQLCLCFSPYRREVGVHFGSAFLNNELHPLFVHVFLLMRENHAVTAGIGRAQKNKTLLLLLLSQVALLTPIH